MGGHSGCRNESQQAQNDLEAFREFTQNNNDLYNTGKVKSIRELISKCDSYYRSASGLSPHCMASVYDTKSNLYLSLREFDSSTIYIDSTLYVMEKNNLDDKFVFEYVGYLSQKGELLYVTNHFTQAYNYYFKAKELAEKLNDTCAFQMFSHGLAMIAYRQKKYREAADYFRRSYQSVMHCTEPYAYQMQEDLDNVALCYEKLRIWDSALYYYDSAISFILHNPGQLSVPMIRNKALAVVYGNMGGVFLAMGATDTAIGLLKSSFATNIQPQFDNTDAVLTHIKLAKAYLAKNDMALLQQALAELRKELDSIHHPLEAEKSWKELMYRYYEKTGDQPEAFRYYKEYAGLRDSLWELDKVQLEYDLSRELKDKEQMNQIGLLQQENKVSNLYLLATIGFSVLALAIIVLVYINYRRGKKNILELKELNSRIHEQKRQLEHTTNELRISSADKDRILHVVAHDLRNPVSAIMMLADIIQQEEVKPGQKEALDMITKASQSGLALIAELLEFSNDTRGNSTPRKENTDLNELVKQCTDLLQFKAAEKKQSLQLLLSAQPLTIFASKEKLNRVLGNLITNAIKFSPELSAVSISVSQHNGKALVEIKDNGIGIPEKYKGVIFEPFTSAKRYGTNGEKSFGLGLSICKQIIEANEGRIWFESTEGTGTTFFIEMPLAEQDAENV